MKKLIFLALLAWALPYLQGFATLHFAPCQYSRDLRALTKTTHMVSGDITQSLDIH